MMGVLECVFAARKAGAELTYHVSNFATCV